MVFASTGRTYDAEAEDPWVSGMYSSHDSAAAGLFQLDSVGLATPPGSSMEYGREKSWVAGRGDYVWVVEERMGKLE